MVASRLNTEKESVHQGENVMKKILFVAAAMVLLLGGCQNPTTGSAKAQVRFSNRTMDAQFPYGLKLGDAAYNGGLIPGDVTSYFETTPGTYSLSVKTSTGAWANAATGTATLEASKKYTVVISGSFTLETMVWSVGNESASLGLSKALGAVKPLETVR